MVFLAVQFTGTEVIWDSFRERNNRKLICIALNDISSGNFNCQKYHKDEVYL